MPSESKVSSNLINIWSFTWMEIQRSTPTLAFQTAEHCWGSVTHCEKWNQTCVISWMYLSRGWKGSSQIPFKDTVLLYVILSYATCNTSSMESLWREWLRPPVLKGIFTGDPSSSVGEKVSRVSLDGDAGCWWALAWVKPACLSAQNNSSLSKLSGCCERASERV